MATLYIHIGTPKTGTTAIQKYLCANRKELEKQGCQYPKFKKKYSYAQPSRNGCFIEEKSFDEDVYKECMDQIVNAFESFSTIILSDEGIWNSGAAKKKTWKRLVSVTEPNNIQVKIIVYLRRQDEYIFSHWSQIIKDRRLTDTFPEYCNEASYKKEHMDYLQMLDTIAEFVGKENIIVRPYEKKQFVDGSIIPDFLDVVGISRTEEFKERSGADNISYKDSILELKRKLNGCPTYLAKADKSDLRKYIAPLQKKLLEEGRLKDRKDLTPQLRQEIVGRFAEGNQEVARKYMNREDGVLFYDMDLSKESAACDFSKDEMKYNYKALLKSMEYATDIAFTKEDFKKIYKEMFGENPSAADLGAGKLERGLDKLFSVFKKKRN